MAEFPALPLFTDAYLGDTTHLTTTEHGAYLLLMITMWRTKSGSLPDDDKLLARYSKLTSTQWSRMRPIIEPFFDVTDGVWTQGRLTDELLAVRQLSKRQSDKVKGRWLKNKEKPIPGNNRGNTSPTPPIVVSKDTTPPAVSGVVMDMNFQKFWHAYPGRGKDGATGAGFKGTRQEAFKEFSKIINNAKDAEREIIFGNIIQGCGRYAGHLDATGYPSKHARTWLHNRGWEDDYTTTAGNGRPGGKSARAADTLRRSSQDLGFGFEE